VHLPFRLPQKPFFSSKQVMRKAFIPSTKAGDGISPTIATVSPAVTGDVTSFKKVDPNTPFCLSKNNFPHRTPSAVHDRDSKTPSVEKEKLEPSIHKQREKSNPRRQNRKSVDVQAEYQIDNNRSVSLAQPTGLEVVSHKLGYSSKSTESHGSKGKRAYGHTSQYDAHIIHQKIPSGFLNPKSRILASGVATSKVQQHPAKRHQKSDLSRASVRDASAEIEIESVEFLTDNASPSSEPSYEDGSIVDPKIDERSDGDACVFLDHFKHSKNDSENGDSLLANNITQYSPSTTHESRTTGNRGTTGSTHKPGIISMDEIWPGSSEAYSTYSLRIDHQSKWNITESSVPYSAEGLVEWEKTGQGTLRRVAYSLLEIGRRGTQLISDYFRHCRCLIFSQN
jgi:hypothetical protein